MSKDVLLSKLLKQDGHGALSPGEDCVLSDTPVLCGIVLLLSIGNEKLDPAVLRGKRSVIHVINGLYQSNR